MGAGALAGLAEVERFGDQRVCAATAAELKPKTSQELRYTANAIRQPSERSKRSPRPYYVTEGLTSKHSVGRALHWALGSII